MAANRLKTNYSNREATDSFVVDSLAELALLPTTTSAGTGTLDYLKDKAALGSSAIVNNSGTIEYYMLFSSGWVQM